jgi:eukaryotic-like serine/threonine-protein kinase
MVSCEGGQVSRIGCVSEADMRALLLGELPEPLSRLVTLHLETCAACEATARRLDDVTDPFVLTLREVVPAIPLDVRTAKKSHADTALFAHPVADYQLLGELGRGGMSVVYKARQSQPDRVVALKMILSGPHSDPERRARFLAEADAIARLQHPQIVQIHEAGQHEGLPFLALEYMGGGTLAGRLSGRPQPPREAAALLEGLARAVDYAHTQGVVHRDLKPSNVLLTEQGQPKLADFGLAKFAENGLTLSGAILGTPAYMAPEQAVGDNRAVGPAADIYALGAILYELLTGRPPFQGATPLETLEQTISQDPVPPCQLQGKLPRDVNTICLKCLQKEPSRRYASASALADDLQLFQADRPILARPSSTRERAWRWCRRNPAVARLLATVAVLLVVITGGVSVTAHRLRALLKKSDAHLTRATVAENDARNKLWDSYLEQARSRRLSQRRGQRFESLEAVRKALLLPLPPGRSVDELRNEAASAVVLPDLEVVQTWAAWPTGTIQVIFDGAFERYARLDRNGAVSVRRVSDDSEVIRIPASECVAEIILSRDSQFLAVHAKTMEMRVYRVTESVPILIHEYGDVRVAAFSPDSKLLLLVFPDGRISIKTLADGPVVHWPANGTSTSLPSFSPDGRQVAFRTRVDGHEMLQVRDMLTGSVRTNLAHPAEIHCHSWDASGLISASACDDYRIRLWNIATGKQLLVLTGHKNQGIRCIFSPDGERLLSDDWSNLLRVWDVHTGRQLFGTLANLGSQHLSLDGRLPLFAENEVKLARVATGAGFRTLPRRAAGANPAFAGGPTGFATIHTGVALSPDGRLLAITNGDGTCALLDPANGNELGAIPLDRTMPFLFESSGALLTYGSAGVCRWPVVNGRESGTFRVGPQQVLHASYSNDEHGSNVDGRVLAIPNYRQGALLINRDHFGPPLVLGPQFDVRQCAVSADGRWIATGNHDVMQDAGCKIWDASSGKLIKELPVDGYCFVGFSPNGNWLVTTGGGCRLWKVGTWEEGPRVGGNRFVFSADSQVLAVSDDSTFIRLVQPATGREYVRLDSPEQTRLWPKCFTPDGAQLICLGIDSQALHVWDLRVVRTQLAEMGLDWDQPPYPDETQKRPELLHIEVIAEPLVGRRAKVGN